MEPLLSSIKLAPGDGTLQIWIGTESVMERAAVGVDTFALFTRKKGGGWEVSVPAGTKPELLVELSQFLSERCKPQLAKLPIPPVKTQIIDARSVIASPVMANPLRPQIKGILPE